MEALAALGLEGPALLAQIINFVILLVLLRMFVYRPVMGMLEERGNRIRDSLRQADEIKDQLARTQQDYEARMLEGRREAQSIIAQANDASKRLEAESMARAERQAEDLIERARSQINLEKQQAIAALRAELADVAILAASRITRQSLDKKAHLNLINETLAETGKLRIENN